MGTVVKYVGGPLDGQDAKPGPSAARRYSTYRRDDGSRMPANQGDGIFLHGGRNRHGYSCRMRDGVKIYLHATLA